MNPEKLLEVKRLRTHFKTETGRVTAVDDVSFHVNKGEILGIVGESGCGKSVTSQSILRLFDEKYLVKYEGEIIFKNEIDLLKLSKAQMRQARGNEISMIFQDPLSSLNPVLTIGFQIAEAIMLHENTSKEEAMAQAVEMLRLTGIPSPEKRVHDYPHQLSGGMRQRVMIAMSLACKPRLLIADEPTTALDVTIQSQILDLIEDINKRFDMGVIFITHDLGVVAELCDRVVVMYLGQIVEEADIYNLFENPKHPYTKGLIQSIPHMDGDREEELHVIAGTVPSLENVPVGCRFAPRCQFADEQCNSQAPELRGIGDGQKVRCWHAEQIAERKEEVYATS
ncbi:ABC transporter ATP-binding protein [Sporosarcina cyprini]|uniref:ABC transporter ATP-binding protein n=1 Tax=Sporosarcina cyprini TaxID=2910523 RepID=UPI001EE0DB09|nr:ABC transporter ATP-binding protein [Sporosarcina cyprini]MCG3088233.1 ABC transporter ATP-binding protein [Sporosarcina cyprini]